MSCVERYGPSSPPTPASSPSVLADIRHGCKLLLPDSALRGQVGVQSHHVVTAQRLGLVNRWLDGLEFDALRRVGEICFAKSSQVSQQQLFSFFAALYFLCGPVVVKTRCCGRPRCRVQVPARPTRFLSHAHGKNLIGYTAHALYERVRLGQL